MRRLRPTFGRAACPYIRRVTKLTVVIAEDDEDALEMLATLIRLQGHRVFTARDGVQALAQVKAVGPDAAVLDLEMPRLSGFDAAAILAGAYPACV